MTRYSARLIRGQVNRASPNDLRLEHPHPPIAGNLSYGFSGDDSSRIKAVHFDVGIGVFQSQNLGQSLNAELGRAIGAPQELSLFSLRRRNINDRSTALRSHDLESFSAAYESPSEVRVQHLEPYVQRRP